MRLGVKTPQVPVANPVETHLLIKIFATRPVLYVKVLLVLGFAAKSKDWPIPVEKMCTCAQLRCGVLFAM